MRIIYLMTTLCMRGTEVVMVNFINEMVWMEHEGAFLV